MQLQTAISSPSAAVVSNVDAGALPVLLPTLTTSSPLLAPSHSSIAVATTCAKGPHTRRYSTDETHSRYFPGFCTPHYRSDDDASPTVSDDDEYDEDEDDDDEDEADDEAEYGHRWSSSLKGRPKRKLSFFTSLHDQIRESEEQESVLTSPSRNNNDVDDDIGIDIDDNDTVTTSPGSTHTVKVSPGHSPPVFVRPSSYGNLAHHPALDGYTPGIQIMNSALSTAALLRKRGLVEQVGGGGGGDGGGVTKPPTTTGISMLSRQEQHERKLKMLQAQLLHQQRIQLQAWLQRNSTGQQLQQQQQMLQGSSQGSSQVVQESNKMVNPHVADSTTTGEPVGIQNDLQQQQLQQKQQQWQHLNLLEEAAKRAEMGIMLRDLKQLDM